MFKPLALYIGLRYTRAKKRQHFVSFISLASMLGIALGVCVLITVLSVMNGFDYEIQNRLFNLAYQVSVQKIDGPIKAWHVLQKTLNHTQEVKASAPFIRQKALLTHLGESAPLLITGILPDAERHVSDLSHYMTEGTFETLKPHHFNIIIGEALAANLGLGVGDKAVLLTTQASATPFGIQPRYRQFTVSGVFYVPGNAAMNASLGFIDLRDAQILYHMKNHISGLRLSVDNLYAAPSVAKKLNDVLPPNYLASDWTQAYGTFFKAIKMEKTMIFLLLLFIIAVATFNLVSSLVMAINDKQPDIAILRTFGATPRTVMGIFMVQGIAIGSTGVLLGLASGVALALHVSQIVNSLQHALHTQWISPSVYMLDHLPSRLQWTDVRQVCAIALGMSFIATLYPAWRAAHVQPAEALRYE